MIGNIDKAISLVNAFKDGALEEVAPVLYMAIRMLLCEERERVLRDCEEHRVYYSYVDDGDIIEETDEVLIGEEEDFWAIVPACLVGTHAPNPYYPTNPIYRRYVKRDR